MELPIPEEIYDLDTFSLRELVTNLHEHIARIELIENKQAQEAHFLKKGKKLLAMAELELDERGTVEKFGEFCIANEENFLSYFEKNLNPYINNKDGMPARERSPEVQKSTMERDNFQIQNNEERRSDSHSRRNQENATSPGNRNLSFSQFSTNSAV